MKRLILLLFVIGVLMILGAYEQRGYLAMGAEWVPVSAGILLFITNVKSFKLQKGRKRREGSSNDIQQFRY